MLKKITTKLFFLQHTEFKFDVDPRTTSNYQKALEAIMTKKPKKSSIEHFLQEYEIHQNKTPKTDQLVNHIKQIYYYFDAPTLVEKIHKSWNPSKKRNTIQYQIAKKVISTPNQQTIKEFIEIVDSLGKDWYNPCIEELRKYEHHR